MDGEPARRASRWPLVFAGMTVFGLFVVASGLTLASVPVTVQGLALVAVGVLALVFTGVRRTPLPRRLPSPVPLAVPAGALVLVATAVESARTEVSPWAPLGLLTGVALLSAPIRALPAVPRPQREPSAAVVLVVIGLVLMIGYETLRHLLAPSAEDLPSYLAAVGMPFAAALGAAALALLAGNRGGMAGLAAGGALVLVSAGLSMARAAGDRWWVRHADLGGDSAASFLEPGYRRGVEQSAVSISYGDTGDFPGDGTAMMLLVVGVALVVTGWWWAAVRRAAG
jgi:hypothetical protein